MNGLKHATSKRNTGENWLQQEQAELTDHSNIEGRQSQASPGRMMEINADINNIDQIADLVCIFSKTPLWSNILQSQFKRLGFKTSVCFSDFSAMITYIMHGILDDTLGKYALAVGDPDIAEFLIPWENMRRQEADHKIKELLDGIPVFFMMQHWQNVNPLLIKAYGKRNVLVYNDSVYTNQRKVIQAMKLEVKRKPEEF